MHGLSYTRSSWTWLAICFSLRAVVLVPVSAAPPSIEQVNDALDIAEITARGGFTSLSTDAVRRALQYGTPDSLHHAERVDRLSPNVLIDTISPAPLTSREAIQQRIPQCLLGLSELWRDSAAPRDAYLALRDVVMPPHRPGVFMLHCLPMNVNPAAPDRLPKAKSVARELIVWALRARRLDELRGQIALHQARRSVEAELLKLMCAVESADSAEIVRSSTTLREAMRHGNSRATAELVSSVAATIQRDDSNRRVAADLLEIAGRMLNRIDQLRPQPDSPAGAILLAAARLRFEDGRQAEAVELLRHYLSVKKRNRNGLKSQGARDQQAATVARELMRRGLASQAQELLGATALAGLHGKYAAGGLVPWTSGEQRGNPVPASSHQRLPRINRVVDDAAGPEPGDIWICRHDFNAGQSTVLFALPDFTSVADPVTSADGARIVFAATRPGEAVTSDKQLYTTDTAGQRLSCLGRGTLASWSPLGQRLVFSRFAPEGGVWISDVARQEVWLLDETGWGGCWSPDGSRIAYAKSVGRRWEVILHDIVEDESIRLSGGRAGGPASIAGGFAWSADSQHLIVKTTGTRRPGAPDQLQRITAIDVAGTQQQRTLFESAGQIGPRVCWFAGSRSVAVCSLKLGPARIEQLYVVDPSAARPTTLIEGQMTGRRNSAASWIPGTRTLIYVSKPSGTR